MKEESIEMKIIINDRIVFLETHRDYLKGKIDFLEKGDPGNPHIYRYLRELRETQIDLGKWIAKLNVYKKDNHEDGQQSLSQLNDSETERVKRYELLKSFGAGLLDIVLKHVPDENVAEVVQEASNYGKGFEC